jgi:hypothetical protein
VVVGRLRAWQLRCIQHLEESGAATLEAIVRLNDASVRTPARAKSQRVVDFPHDIRTRTKTFQATDPVPQGLELDFVLQLTQSTPLPEALENVRHGVWHFNFSDGNAFTTRAPYFWEIYRDHDVSGAMLLRRQEHPASLGSVLAAGYFPTIRTSYAENVDQCFFRSAGWPAKICRELLAHTVAAGPTLPLPATAYGFPNLFARLWCSLKMLRNRALAFAHNFLRPYWNIALVRLPPARTGEVSQVHLLQPEVLTDYFADPFAFEVDKRRYIFCERFSYLRNRGNLSYFEVQPNGQSPLETMLAEPLHLSYPHVFEADDGIYCVPETSKANEVRLYKAVRFPSVWALDAVLLRDFPAVDPTLHRFEGRWWMFCTRLGEGYVSDLYIWHADNLIGPWRPHARNPVKIDARSARPAGRIFTRDGELYRPAQDCSRSYGGRLVINKVSKLTEIDFEETVDAVIEPPSQGPYRYGLHTIALAGERAVVDLKRYRFSTLATRVYFGERVRKALNGLGFSDAQIDRVKNRFMR